RDDHVVDVGAVVHDVHHDVLLGDPLERCLVLVVDGHSVQQVEHELGEVVADLVIRQDVELGDDLVDVARDARLHLGVGDAVLAGVVLCSGPHDGVGGAAPSIFCRALASASGLRVNCALIASARYSRLRLTPSASSWAMIGARIHETIQTRRRARTSGLALRPSSRDPPPGRNMRLAPSCISATAPTSAASVVMRRTSRFFTWPSSWAITPCSSSRVQRSSSPRVTATWECSGSVPVANAFGSGSSTIQMRGRGTPAAIAIACTPLTS